MNTKAAAINAETHIGTRLLHIKLDEVCTVVGETEKSWICVNDGDTRELTLNKRSLHNFKIV